MLINIAIFENDYRKKHNTCNSLGAGVLWLYEGNKNKMYFHWPNSGNTILKKYMNQ